mmetsp:Transcript_12892/g.29175  ORF Transcript_12892/g.29175 Transcript_12892/m.29175 type:complete len:202 (-) Transcript_12892:1625-2230(-)
MELNQQPPSMQRQPGRLPRPARKQLRPAQAGRQRPCPCLLYWSLPQRADLGLRGQFGAAQAQGAKPPLQRLYCFEELSPPSEALPAHRPVKLVCLCHALCLCHLHDRREQLGLLPGRHSEALPRRWMQRQPHQPALGLPLLAASQEAMGLLADRLARDCQPHHLLYLIHWALQVPVQPLLTSAAVFFLSGPGYGHVSPLHL